MTSRTPGHIWREAPRCHQQRGWYEQGRVAAMLWQMLLTMLGPNCVRCHTPYAGPLRTRAAAQPPSYGSRRAQHRLTRFSGFLKHALLVRQAYREYLCAQCARPLDMPQSEALHRSAYTRFPHHAKVALRAMLGDKCEHCGTTENLQLDQIDPPAYTYSAFAGSGQRTRPAGMHRFLYYALLARAGRVRVLCNVCNASRSTADWRQLVAARAIVRNTP